MRTTITLDAKLVAAVREVTGEKTKTKAVVVALEEHVRRKKIEELRALLGKVEVNEAVIQEMEDLEIGDKEG